MEDLYRTLQVDPQAEPEVIDAAWRRLAHIYHPDGGLRPDPARMAAINHAHQVLKDPDRRAQYDRDRAYWGPNPGASNATGPADPSGAAGTGWLTAGTTRCWRHEAWAVTRCASCGLPLCRDCAARWRPPHCDRCVVAQGHSQQAWIAWSVAAAAAWLVLFFFVFTVGSSRLFPTPAGWSPPVGPTLLITYLIGGGIVGAIDLVFTLLRNLPKDVRRRAVDGLGVIVALLLLPVTILAGAVFVPIRFVMALVAFLRGTARVRAAYASLRSGGG